MRHAVAPDGTYRSTEDVIELAHLGVAELEAEGRAAGFAPEPARRIEATGEHVGSGVVVLRG